MQASRASGSAILDSTPPSPADKIYSKESAPGEDTQSLLGDPDSAGGNPSLQTPGGKIILSASMFMQAVNLRESVAPGSIPEPIKMWVASQMQEAPLLAEQLSRQGDPMAMLSAVGNSAANPQQTAPMGMTAMFGGGQSQPPQQPNGVQGGGMFG